MLPGATAEVHLRACGHARACALLAAARSCAPGQATQLWAGVAVANGPQAHDRALLHTATATLSAVLLVAPPHAPLAMLSAAARPCAMRGQAGQQPLRHMRRHSCAAPPAHAPTLTPRLALLRARPCCPASLPEKPPSLLPTLPFCVPGLVAYRPPACQALPDVARRGHMSPFLARTEGLLPPPAFLSTPLARQAPCAAALACTHRGL